MAIMMVAGMPLSVLLRAMLVTFVLLALMAVFHAAIRMVYSRLTELTWMTD